MNFEAKMHFWASNTHASKDMTWVSCQMLHAVHYMFSSVAVPGLLETRGLHMQFTAAPREAGL